MKLEHLTCTAIHLLWCFTVQAQLIFPELTDQALLDALVAEYKPASVLPAAQARDTLYAVIDIDQDSVRGIYSGYALYLPEGVDPSQAIFMNGDGINLEHSWPRSKGAQEGTQGHSDMHHLYPSRVAVNSARASNPFAEIDDQETMTWFYLAIAQSSIPSGNIDAYSEATDTAFEPREEVKGDIARSAFYFYTMYRDEADAADPDYFESQRQTLLAWHAADPATAAEQARSIRVALYQDGKENPYVLDPTLAERAFCDKPPCTTTYVEKPVIAGTSIHMTLDGCTLTGHVDQQVVSILQVRVVSTSGRLAAASVVQPSDEILIDLCALPAGMYLVTIYSENRWLGVRRVYFSK